MSTRIFISYKRADKEIVFPIKDMIESALGTKCWIDVHGIESDAAFVANIIGAIDACEIFLFMYSAHHNEITDFEKDWTIRELSYAERNKKRIVFINIDKTQLNRYFSFLYSQKQQIDGTFPDEISKLIADMRKWLGIETSSSEVPQTDGNSENHSPQGAEIHIEVDIDTRVMRFREQLLIATPSEDNVAYLKMGKHKLIFSSVEFPEITETRIVDVPTNDYCDFIEVRFGEKCQNQSLAKAPVDDTEKQSAILLETPHQAKSANEKTKEDLCQSFKKKETTETLCSIIEGLLKHAEEKVTSNEDTQNDSNRLFNVDGAEFKMIRIDGGTFKMGATEEQDDYAKSNERPIHNVTLNDYYIAEVPVTQELWVAVMGTNPSNFSKYDSCKDNNMKVFGKEIRPIQKNGVTIVNPYNPVEKVSRDMCLQFIEKLNALTGAKFRLPTEAEWEYAARGGAKSWNYIYSGSNNIDKVAWYGHSLFGNWNTYPVAQFLPNELGIYDMSGNVWEWCQDAYEKYNEKDQANPCQTSSDKYATYSIRGGDFECKAARCRVTCRDSKSSNLKLSTVGVRLAMDI